METAGGAGHCLGAFGPGRWCKLGRAASSGSSQPRTRQLGSLLAGVMREVDRGAGQRIARGANPAAIDAFLAVGRVVEAADLARQALADDPDNPLLHCQLAFALFRLQQDRGALVEAERAIAIQPDLEWAHRMRALALGSLGKTKQGVKAALEARRLAPEGREGLLVLFHLQATRRRWRAARATVDELLRVAPEWVEAHLARADVALSEWKADESEAAARRAIELQPDYANAHLALGNALRSQKRNSDALQAYQEAVRLDPSLAQAQRQIGRLTRPASIPQIAWSVVRVVIAPWTIPVVIGQALFRARRNEQTIQTLRPGVQLFARRRGTAWYWALGIAVALAAICIVLLGALAVFPGLGLSWSAAQLGYLLAYVCIYLLIAAADLRRVTGDATHLREGRLAPFDWRLRGAYLGMSSAVAAVSLYLLVIHPRIAALGCAAALTLFSAALRRITYIANARIWALILVFGVYLLSGPIQPNGLAVLPFVVAMVPGIAHFMGMESRAKELRRSASA